MASTTTHCAATLYRDFGPVVFRRCLRLLGEREAARDATQDVFARLVRDLPKLRERETVLPWMYCTATNHCLNLLRNAHRRGEERWALDVGGDASARAEAPPSRALAQAVLSRFDAVTQAVAVGVIVDDMEHGELAAALGLSRRSVARRLGRFLAGAREHLAEAP